MAAPVLQFKRGLFSNLPALRAGEPGFTTDKYDLYVGIDSTTANNQFVGSGRFWTIESATKGSGVNLVEGTNNGTSYITLASPASLAGIVTYYFPGTQGGSGSVLTNDGSGNLSWGAGSNNSTLTGVTTVTGHFDIDSTVDISGVTTFTNTTDNTLGNVNTGSVQLDGGLGVAKNVTVGGNINVQGYAEFVGVATFKGGTINLGDADTDDINVAGEFISSLVPNDDDSYDLGESGKEWRNLHLDGTANIDTLSADTAAIGDLTNNRVVIAGTSGELEDDANLTYDGTDLSTNSLIVGDLTDNRVVIAGSSGAIEDDANLTYDGTDLSTNSLIVGDLTDNRVVIAGSSGAIEDSANLTFNGSVLAVTGDLTVSDSITSIVDVNASGIVTATAFAGHDTLVGAGRSSSAVVTFKVTVASKTTKHRYLGSGSSSAYFIDGQESPFITFIPGRKYKFDQADSSNNGHPLRFYLEAVKTTAYSTNVTTNGTAGQAGAYTEIEVTDTTPTVLHYQCSAHAYMGNAANFLTNVVHTNNQAVFLDDINVAGVSTFTGAIDCNGGANISGAETILSSATVSDLTDNRVVIAGSSGALEDSANLTFNGSTLAVTGTAAVTGDVTVSDSITVTKDAVVSAGLTVTGAIDGNGGANISGAETVLSSATVSDLTDNRVVIAGTSGALEDSGNLTFNGTTLAVTGAATVDNLSLDANTLTTSSGGLTLDSASGTTTVADDLTVNGTFTVLGSQSIINTETLKVEDSLIEVGLVNSGGSLVAPSSDANIDVGVVMHYYSGSAKTAAMFWDDSAGRIVIADEVSESSSVMGSISYANLEIGALTVSDCQGNSQAVISCSGSTRSLENITVDGGSF